MVVLPLYSLCNLSLSLCHSSRKRNKTSQPTFPIWVQLNTFNPFVLATKSDEKQLNEPSRRLTVFSSAKGKDDEEEAKESIPTWAKPGSEEPPPWTRDEGGKGAVQQSFEVPFFVYLLASAVTAIAAIGSVFEYLNQRPVFGVLGSDSIFYAPVLGFFAFTGIPTSAFLWFKSVQVANKEADEQDRRDGYL